MLWLTSSQFRNVFLDLLASSSHRLTAFAIGTNWKSPCSCLTRKAWTQFLRPVTRALLPPSVHEICFSLVHRLLSVEGLETT
jgi:hypothetical protein